MKYLYNKADLVLLGRWENEEYKRKCMNLEEWEKVKYLGYVSYTELLSIVKKADIGLINFYHMRNHLTSLPSKLFSYMACSLPMVVSNFDYWQKLFGECALFADPYNPEDIANKILYLLDNPDVMKKMGIRGRKLIEEKYSWESESKKLLDMYKKL
jgi:glycosyltransferase involved in cell wall biosynthesis